MGTYYHFLPEDKKLRFGDNREVKLGQTITVDCEPELCYSGLHASKRLIDALDYAPGPILTKVTLGGTVIHGHDKSVATERTIIAIADVSYILREFARKCALDVIHLWDAPKVVIKYLKTCDESIMYAAWYAVGTAIDDDDNNIRSAGSAAMYAAWHALSSDASSAAREADWCVAGRDKQNRRLEAMIKKANWVEL